MSKFPQENLGEALEAAVREAVDDKTFQKVKRCSYAQGPHDVSFNHLNLMWIDILFLNLFRF